MPWPLPTDLTNETTGLLEGTAEWAYEVTQGTFWSMLLAAFCIVLWISSSRFGQERSLGYAAITGLFGSIFLLILGLMPWWIASVFIIAGTAGITYMIMNR